MDNSGLSARPTLRQLEYWVAVAEHRHFGRAAEACGVTQPGLSAQLLQLETTLGITLFERSRRGVMPTSDGARLLPHARAALRSIDELSSAARESSDPFAGDLRLGVIPTIAPYLLPKALPAVRKKHPKLRCILLEDQTERLLEKLRDGALDLVLAAIPLDGDDITQRALYSEPFVVAVHVSDPLAKRTEVRQQDLANRDVLLLEDGHCLRAQALAVCERAGSHEVAGLRATSLATLVAMVGNGIGSTLLPKTAADALLKGSEVVGIPFRSKAPGRTIGFVWRKASSRSAVFLLLAEIFAEVGARLAAR